MICEKFCLDLLWEQKVQDKTKLAYILPIWNDISKLIVYINELVAILRKS